MGANANTGLVDPRCSTENAIDFTAETIEVFVGMAQRKFITHEKIVVSHSPFFKAALGSLWREGTDRVVMLPEDSPDAFSAYLNYVYTKKLVMIVTDTRKDEHWDALAEMYVLGEKLMDDDFQNCVIDAIAAASRFPAADGHRYYPAPSAISIVYGGTPEGSPVRTLLADLYVCHGRPGWRKDIAECPHGFLVDVTTKLLEVTELKAEGKARSKAIQDGVLKSYYKSTRK